VAINGQKHEKRLHFSLAHLARMPSIKKQNEPTRPLSMGFRGSMAIVSRQNQPAHTIQQLLTHELRPD